MFNENIVCIPTIQDELRKNGSDLARIETDDARSYFLLEIPCREGFETKISEKSELKTTQKTTQKIIELIKDNQTISIEEMADKCGLTRDGIKYQIRKLKQAGHLRRIGPDKGGHWEVLM